jgi:hypothetical protein
MICVEESADAAAGTARAKTSAIRSGRNVTASVVGSRRETLERLWTP